LQTFNNLLILTQKKERSFKVEKYSFQNGNEELTNKKGAQMETITSRKELSNPISDLISDELFELLQTRGLINERAVRDYIIRKKFKSLRAQKLRTGDAIDSLREEYPYLQFDTIRKIVHNPPKSLAN
jgi:hypothetical protein